ncbi:MFS transporter [soil metagenome]
MPAMSEPNNRLAHAFRSYRTVARNPSYAPLLIAKLLSTLGDTLHYIALVILVFELTGQGLAVAILVFAEIIPVMLLGPVAGVVIDRFSRKHVLIGADLIRAALALSLVWPQGTWHAYLVAAGLAAGNTFFNPTVQAVLPALVPDDQRLAANSVSWSVGRLVQIVGAAVAGGLIATIGVDAAFAANALTFLLSAALILQLPVRSRAGQLADISRRGMGAFLDEARAGFNFARHDRFVSRLLVVQAIASLAVGGTGAMLVVLSERHLDLAASGFAWLIGAIGVGALIGPLFVNAFAGDYRNARWLFVPYIVRGIGDVLIAIFTPLLVCAGVLGLALLGNHDFSVQEHVVV